MDIVPAVEDIPGRPAPGFCPPESRPWVLAAAILASSMGFIDGSVVSLAMPAIRADLGATLTDAQWIGNSYMLFLSALVLLGGAAGDVFGVRNIFAAGIVLFMATSAACALAPDAQALILMRGAQGIGAALMVPGSLAIIAKSYPAAERGRAIGIWAATSSLTTALGPFLGGMLLTFGEDWMWRLIFAINVPTGLIALTILFRRVHRDRPAAGRRLDVPGAVLATAGLGLFAWGLTDLGVAPDERLASPVAMLAAGGVLFALFVIWQRMAAAPMVKLGLFRSKAFAGANVFTLVLFFAFNAILFFLPMTVITGWRASELESSLLVLPLSVAIGLLSGYAGRLADRIGPRLPLTVGALLMATCHALLALTMPLMMLWQVTFPVLLLQALGMAMLVSPLSTAVMLATPDEDTGLASGVNNALARVAGLFAIAALGSVAGLVFGSIAPAGLGFEFGSAPAAMPSAADEALRVAATNRAFQAIAALSAGMSLLAALIAWTTQPSWRTGQRPVG